MLSISFQSVITVVFALLGVGGIIAFHELGHFLFCRLFGVTVPSFSIGMGPKIYTKHLRGTNFSLSLIPLGGYVEIAQSPETHPDSDGYFNQKPYWQKMSVIFGGILFNVIFAYLALTLLYIAGMPASHLAYPENAQPIIAHIADASPAQKAGIAIDDRITAIDSVLIKNDVSPLLTYVQEHPGKTVLLEIDRAGKTAVISCTLGTLLQKGKPTGILGLFFKTTALTPYGIGASLALAATKTKSIFTTTIGAFVSLFKQKRVDQLGGPLLIISQTVSHANRGFKIFIAFLALISINLAVLNLIPLPILDGGQALFYTIEAIIRRPIANKVREYIHLATWVLFLLLTLYLTIKDVRFIRNQNTEQRQ